jgi:hypothetical protein
MFFFVFFLFQIIIFYDLIFSFNATLNHQNIALEVRASGTPDHSQFHKSRSNSA